MTVSHNRLGFKGFSLLELIVVMVIMGILMAISAPVLSKFQRQLGRRGAVNVLLNTFEQARVTALSSGANTYIGFAEEGFVLQDKEYRAYVMFRERVDGDDSSIVWQATGNTDLVPLSPWKELPPNVYFYNIGPGLTGNSTTGNTITITNASLSPNVPTPFTLRTIKFNSGGGIVEPSQSKDLRLLIRINAPDTSWKEMFDLEEITFRRFTGRAERNIQLVESRNVSTAIGNVD